MLLHPLYSFTQMFKAFSFQLFKLNCLVLPTEYSRYLHSHLDNPVAEYNVDQDLPGNFKNHWAKNLPFLIEDYEEQPGLQPHIKCVPHELSTLWWLIFLRVGDNIRGRKTKMSSCVSSESNGGMFFFVFCFFICFVSSRVAAGTCCHRTLKATVARCRNFSAQPTTWGR